MDNGKETLDSAKVRCIGYDKNNISIYTKLDSLQSVQWTESDIGSLQSKVLSIDRKKSNSYVRALVGCS